MGAALRRRASAARRAKERRLAPWGSTDKVPLSLDLGSHGNFGGVEVGKAGADPFGPGDDAADAGSNVVGTLIADDLEGHAGHCLA